MKKAFRSNQSHATLKVDNAAVGCMAIFMTIHIQLLQRQLKIAL